jgi:hypothetical protein
MNVSCLKRRMLTALLVAAGWLAASAETGNELLLPFPAEATAGSESSPAETAVPERGTAGELNAADTRRARELAETFLRRQQMEVTNSVPRRGEKRVRVPSRTGSPDRHAGPAIAASSDSEIVAPDSQEFDGPGPSSELLPLPGEDASNMSLDYMLPGEPGNGTAGGAGPVPGDGEVPRSDLAPSPAYGGVENQDRRGPVFRISGPEAFAVARARGFKFTPAGGIGPRDGVRTAASQFPSLLTSEVHGTSMSQLRPPPAWSVAETSNTFFMFCDDNYNAVRLAPGWRVRGIQIEGHRWRWVACPRSGANTASFSIRIYSYKGQEPATVVRLAGLTLEGPEGAVDWREAFPWINGRGPDPAAGGVPARSLPPVQATRGGGSDTDLRTTAAAPGSEPPLPR